MEGSLYYDMLYLVCYKDSQVLPSGLVAFAFGIRTRMDCLSTSGLACRRICLVGMWKLQPF